MKKIRRGFTIIELLVVIVIIAILATIIIISFSNAQEKARDNKRKTDLQSIAAAVDMYYSDNKFYPYTVNTYFYDVNSAGNSPNNCTKDTNSGQNQISCLFKDGYLQNIPKDPKFNNSSITTNYHYYFGSDGISGCTAGVNCHGTAAYKIITDPVNARGGGEVDSFEASGTTSTDCKASAGEYSATSNGTQNYDSRGGTIGLPFECYRLQVKKGTDIIFNRSYPNAAS